MTLNSQDLNLKIFRSHFSVVPQQDNHWAYLTPREAITMATELQHQYSHDEKMHIVDSLIENMGLSSCKDTKVGNQFIQGLSGGQKRETLPGHCSREEALGHPFGRAHLGSGRRGGHKHHDLLQGPRAQPECYNRCDNPPALHQGKNSPSFNTSNAEDPNSLTTNEFTKVYNGFDLAMVLTGGKAAYFGPAAFLGDYLEKIDRTIPKNSNPAEHVLDLVNREFVDPKEVDYMIESWMAYRDRESNNPDSYLHSVAQEIAKQDGDGNPLPEPEPAPGAVSNILTLIKRHAVLTYRDPVLYLGRAAAFLMTCTFFSIVYLKARDRTQRHAPYKVFLFMWHIGVPTALGVVAVIAYNLEHLSIKREVKQGQYSPTSYVIANSVLQLPMMFVLSIMALSIGGYCVSNYHIDVYGQMILLYAATLWSFESMAQLFAVQFPNPLLGMLQYMNLWFASFLFCGIMVPEADVPWPMKLFNYILPLKYFLKSAMHTDLHQTTFSGAILDAEDPRGFSCPRNVTLDGAVDAVKEKASESHNSLACYGFYGDQVLDSLGVTYRSIKSKDTYAEDILIILAIGIFFKIMGTMMTIHSCSATMSISKPSGKKTTK